MDILAYVLTHIYALVFFKDGLLEVIELLFVLLMFRFFIDDPDHDEGEQNIDKEGHTLVSSLSS